MTQHLSELLFDGKSYVGSKQPVLLDVHFMFIIEFRLNRPNAKGILLCTDKPAANSYQIVVYVSSNGVNFKLVGADGSTKMSTSIETPIAVDSWNKLVIRRSTDTWTAKLTTDEITEAIVYNIPTLVSKIYFGGTNFTDPSLMLKYVCARNFMINYNLAQAQDYSIVGALPNCPSYSYDTVATQISSQLPSCADDDQCAVKYFTNYTAASSWDKLACCTRYAGNDPCDVGPDSKNTSPVVAYQSIGNGQIQCIYSRNKIDSFNQAKKSVTVFGEGNAVQDAYCQSKVTGVCPPDMPDGCSRYFAVDETGDYCRNLFNSKTDAEKDAAILNYCTRNNTNDCKCANRSDNADYVRLKQGNPFSDACWYIPCANSSRYLVPSEFKHAANCPEDICQVVFDIAQAHDVDIDHLKLDINCDFSGGGFPHYSIVMWYYIGAYALAIILLIIYAQK